MARRRILLGLLLAAAGPAAAQQIARSSAPDSVDVTVYRAPHRGPGERMQLSWLNGYALISETRRVSIPAGESQLRFEGVAGGILPESAIVTGFPAEVVEKNQDARLLSPSALLDASLGKRVHLRRTSRATGAVRETEAIVRSGENGAVVLQTAEGIEALRCTGLPETLRYDEVPADLSAKPTLSVRARATRATTATVTLSYLASGFDWQANYIAELSPDGTKVDLFAWLTLANGDETSFRNADTQAVAGQINRENVRAPRVQVRPLTLECWAQGTTTSDLREEQIEREEIVVTGMRIAAPMMMAPPPPPPPPPPAPPAMMAQQEDLGDLKLYRIPAPVTVAAKSQKQVALLQKRGVPVRQVYRQRLYLSSLGSVQPVSRVLVARNTKAAGLGLPLPAGRVMLSAKARGRPLLIGRGTMRDHAVGEEVEIVVGLASAISAEVKQLSRNDDGRFEWELTVSNATASPVRYEAELEEYGYTLSAESPLIRRDGRQVWVPTVPANGTATLRFRTQAPEARR
ncbi:MAG TPA: hypothetical protein VGB70_00245 [Allosphingosinicella sp.]